MGPTNPVIGTVVSTGVNETGEPFVNIKLHGPSDPSALLPARPPQPPAPVQAQAPTPSARQRAREAWGVEPQLLVTPTGVPS